MNLKKSILTILFVSILTNQFYAKSKKNIKESKTKILVQIVFPETENLPGTEASWLPGQIQDKIKSNFQEFLDMKTVVDSASESSLKKIQAESENEGRNESMAIKLGRISTAKAGIFSKIRKTGQGYALSIDYTNLENGEQIASVTSKEYSKAEYLYGSTGAIDELTVSLAEKIGIKISDLNKNLLQSGSASFSIDDQYSLSKQNEAHYKKLMKQYDYELSKLSMSNSLDYEENKNKIEAEKALAAEKQRAEQNRQKDLKELQERVAADEKKWAERSIALRTQRDQMAATAAQKAAEVRKLKQENQNVFGRIKIIESKKKALIEIRRIVEKRAVQLYDQMEKDKKREEDKIRKATPYSVELDAKGRLTQDAKQRRENNIIKSNNAFYKKFQEDYESVNQSTMEQQNALIAEIKSDQSSLAAVRTVSSMQDELRYIVGKYDGSKYGWNINLTLYTDGIMLYNHSFILGYASLAEKAVPDVKSASDAMIAEYDNTKDMYTSLMTRGDPIVSFEIDYNVISDAEGNPSCYRFNFKNIRVINVVTGKTIHSVALNDSLVRSFNPVYDISEKEGIIDSVNAKEEKINRTMKFNGIDRTKAIKKIADDKKAEKKRKLEAVLDEVYGPKTSFSVGGGAYKGFINGGFAELEGTLRLGLTPVYMGLAGRVGGGHYTKDITATDRVLNVNKMDGTKTSLYAMGYDLKQINSLTNSFNNFALNLFRENPLLAKYVLETDETFGVYRLDVAPLLGIGFGIPGIFAPRIFASCAPGVMWVSDFAKKNDDGSSSNSESSRTYFFDGFVDFDCGIQFRIDEKTGLTFKYTYEITKSNGSSNMLSCYITIMTY